MKRKRRKNQIRHTAVRNNHMTTREKIFLGMFIVLLAVLFFVVFKRQELKKMVAQLKNPQDIGLMFSSSRPTPTPFPPVPEPLPQGKQVYSVSRGENSKGPDPREVTVDPFDPKKGEKQTFTVQLNHTKPVTTVSIILKTDHGEKTYPLNFQSKSDTNEVWAGTWTTNDTHDILYHAIVQAKDDTDTSSVELSFR